MHTRSRLVVAALGMLMMLAAASARANLIVVNSLYDPSASRRCTLHDAIIAANTGVAVNGCKAGSGNDTIIFYVSGTIVLSETLPEIEKTLNISGPPANITISGNNAVQVMLIDTSAVVYLSNLTIANGLADSQGAGIFNLGALTIDRSTFSNNSVTGGSLGLGGAIANAGTLNVSNSSFMRNSATSSGLVTGGAIGQESPNGLTVTYCTFSANRATAIGENLVNGGAIGQDGPGLILVKNSTFTKNTVASEDGLTIGGAVGNGGTNIDIENSTFFGNGASNSNGGQVFGGAVGSGGDNVTVYGDTFSGNSASGGEEAKIYGGAVGNGGGALAITNSTFAKNYASGSGGGSVVGGGVGGVGPFTVYFSTLSSNVASSTGGGTVLGGNFGSDFGTPIVADSILAAGAGGNCGGVFSDAGYNISDDASCAFTATGSKNDTNPKLSPFGLANNGGPTQTIALTAYSPAIDAIPHAACVDASGDPVTMDQRGFPRPDREDGPYGPCDIGAYEFQAPLHGGY
jgi:hypothetical protein